MTRVTINEWESFLTDQENVHILQTAQWAELKQRFGWSAHHFVHETSGAQLLLRRLPLGFHIAYIPMGPIGQPNAALINEIRLFCKQKHCIFLKIEVDIWQDEFDESPLANQLTGWISAKSVQPPNTIVLDLSEDEDSWLAGMKQKTRYNIRLAKKKEIQVQESESVETFHDLMIETGQRDEFGVHSKAYYQAAFDLFHPKEKCKLFIASYDEIPLAGIMIFISGKRSWYFYGASNNKERNRMPTYLLQWVAMQYCAARGCTSYDLWGIPDADEKTLEDNFMDRQDGLWSVYRFKRGFGGQIRRLAGAWDEVYIKPIYWLYRWWSERNALD
ncbi:MAG: peptidoglycan bridge formation glycyltransferase FemA/FemB family protein [Anaerolineaceae bacterium]|nr:peptidoglycan bridge formation glycyltransferase FemA/FemB family protein [Anaerolineaceae bacterium]